VAETIIFLTEDEIVTLHDIALERDGGLPGIKGGCSVSTLVEYAPNKAYYKREQSVPSLAGSYAFAAARFHIFNDGNKRVAAALAEVFLLKNEMELIADDEDAFVMLSDLATGAISEEDFATWMEENTVAI